MYSTIPLASRCAAVPVVIGLVSGAASAGPGIDASGFARDLSDHRHVDTIRAIDHAEIDTALQDFPLLAFDLDQMLSISTPSRGALEAFLDSLDLDTAGGDLFNRGSPTRTPSSQSPFTGGFADMSGSTSLNDRTVIPLPTPGLLAAGGLAFVAATRRVRRA